jgi:hypothetical protein
MLNVFMHIQLQHNQGTLKREAEDQGRSATTAAMQNPGFFRAPTLSVEEQLRELTQSVLPP